MTASILKQDPKKEMVKMNAYLMGFEHLKYSSLDFCT